MAKAKKTKTIKKLASKKTKTKIAPAENIASAEVGEFWTKFENDLYNNPEEYKKFPLDYNNVQFQGHLKNISCFKKNGNDSVDLFADDRPWFAKAWSKVTDTYKSAADYAWFNPVKTFFIMIGVVFAVSIVTSAIKRL